MQTGKNKSSSSHKKHCSQHRHATGHRQIARRIGIDERTGVITARQRFGDWEGGTVEARKAVGTTQLS